MPKKILNIAELQIAAKKFCEKESGLYRSELFGVTDGKAVGTFVEHLFQEYLEQQYEMTVGSSANGLDLPSVNTDIKVTSIKQHNQVALLKTANKKYTGLVITLLYLFTRRVMMPKQKKDVWISFPVLLLNHLELLITRQQQVSRILLKTMVMQMTYLHS